MVVYIIISLDFLMIQQGEFMLGGMLIGGGGRFSFEMLKGWFIRFVGYSWVRGLWFM